MSFLAPNPGQPPGMGFVGNNVSDKIVSRAIDWFSEDWKDAPKTIDNASTKLLQDSREWLENTRLKN